MVLGLSAQRRSLFAGIEVHVVCCLMPSLRAKVMGSRLLLSLRQRNQFNPNPREDSEVSVTL